MTLGPLFGILPMKTLRSAKARLAPCLSTPERRELVMDLYLRAMRAARTVVPGQRIAVISHDHTVLRLADGMGLHALAQRSRGLNPAVREGRDWAMAAGAGGLLVLLADLPLVTGTALEGLLRSAQGGREVILARGQRGGTHALFVRPPDLLDFCFGNGSLRRFEARARRAGTRLVVHDSPTLAMDLDLPEDLAQLRGSQQPATPWSGR